MKPTISLALILLVEGALCWWDTAHATVAEIAKLEVSREKRQIVDRILRFENSTLPYFTAWGTSAFFPDFLKAEKLYGMSSWHYKDVPYLQQWQGATPAIDAANLVDALGWVMTSLNRTTSVWTAALCLRFLFHLVGDMHQPLHCATLYSPNFPNGDLGGNRFRINFANHPMKDLHSFWDSCAGQYVDYGPGRSPQIAVDLKNEFGPVSGPLLLTDWSAIVTESHQIAINSVYRGVEINEILTDASNYTTRARSVCRRQIRIAGARLAAAIESLQFPVRQHLPDENLGLASDLGTSPARTGGGGDGPMMISISAAIALAGVCSATVGLFFVILIHRMRRSSAMTPIESAKMLENESL